MHKSPSSPSEPVPAPLPPRRRRLRLYLVVTTALAGLGAATALAAGITPASAANLAQNSDTQIAVFMIPLTLLMFALLVEVTRIAMRGALPVPPTPRRPSRLPWTPGSGEG